MANRLALLPAGEAEASLLPGEFIIVWYDSDDVWHERLLIWKRADGTWEILTPDGDKYCEDYRKNGQGPDEIVRLPATGEIPPDVMEPVYRFRSYFKSVGHRACLRQGFLDAKAEDADTVVLFSSVYDYAGELASVTEVVGRDALPRRVPRKTGRPDTGVLVTPVVDDKATDNSWDKVVSKASVAPKGYMWVAAETHNLYPLGNEVELDVLTDFMVGDRNALHKVGDNWLRCELVAVEVVPAFVNAAKERYDWVCEKGGETPRGTEGGGRPEPLGAPAGAAADDEAEDREERGEEVRTLEVDFDAHQERYKPWRLAVQESRSYVWPQVPVDLGPWTLLDLMKSMGRNNGDAQTWLTAWAKAKGIEENDRVMHEMRTLINILFYAVTFDQLNCPSLLSFELVNRRICTIIEAYRNPSKVDWSQSKHYSAHKQPEDIIPDSLRAYVARKGKEERELNDGKRTLAAPYGQGQAAVDAAADAVADGAVGGAKGAKSRGRGKAKAKGLPAPAEY